MRSGKNRKAKAARRTAPGQRGGARTGQVGAGRTGRARLDRWGKAGQMRTGRIGEVRPDGRGPSWRVGGPRLDGWEPCHSGCPQPPTLASRLAQTGRCPEPPSNPATRQQWRRGRQLNPRVCFLVYTTEQHRVTTGAAGRVTRVDASLGRRFALTLTLTLDPGCHPS